MTSERTTGNFQFLQPISSQLVKLGTPSEELEDTSAVEAAE